MPPRGRKPQAKEQKAAKGETRPSRQGPTVVEFPKADGVPDPPPWIAYEAGMDLWDELAPLLFAQKVLSTVDIHALGHLCQLHGKIVDDYSRRLAPTAAELSQLRMYFSEFGLTPSSRTRVGTTGNGKKDNPFSQNGQKGRPGS